MKYVFATIILFSILFSKSTINCVVVGPNADGYYFDNAATYNWEELGSGNSTY